MDHPYFSISPTARHHELRVGKFRENNINNLATANARYAPNAIANYNSNTQHHPK
jgi:hypothetical protein